MEKRFVTKCKNTMVFVLATCLICFINMYIVRLAYVTGESMYPTLLDGDLILVNVMNDNPSKGDIVLIDTSENSWIGKFIVKRVIAIEGDTVTLDYEHNIVYVNGVGISEPYLNKDWGDPMIEQDGMSMVTYQVPQGAYFVMGDNRNKSIDSRDEILGMIERTEIVGVVFVHFSVTNL